VGAKVRSCSIILSFGAARGTAPAATMSKTRGRIVEIQKLRLLITEADTSQLAALLQANNPKVKNMQIRIETEGVRLSGTYQTVVGVNFETLWKVSIQEGKLAAHLAEFKAAGFGGGMMQAMFMSVLNELVKKEDALAIQGDTLILDAERLLTEKGVSARLNLAAVHCEPGQLVVESAAPTV
jgi:hypothetical protein